MSLEAAGAYLRTLREHQGLSRVQVADAAGTSESQLVRIEGGKQDPRGSLWFAIASVLQGSTEQLSELLTTRTLKADDGRRIAEDWLTRDQRRTIEQISSRHGNERVREAVRSLRELSSTDLLQIISEASELLQARQSQPRSSPRIGKKRRRGWPLRQPRSARDDESSASP